MSKDLYTRPCEQGQVGLEQTEAILAALRGIRATLRRMVLDSHARWLRTRQPFLSWEQAVQQSFAEVGYIVTETIPEAMEDDPLPPDYTPSV